MAETVSDHKINSSTATSRSCAKVRFDPGKDKPGIRKIKAGQDKTEGDMLDTRELRECSRRAGMGQ